MIRRFLATIIFLGFYQLANAQCAESLNKARDEFNAGHLNAISGMLDECRKNGTKEQQIEAYKLLTITYLYLDDPYGAEQSFLALLEVEPEYRVSENDPIELKYLSEKFITTPITSFSVKAGANFSTVTVLNINTVGNENDQNWQYSALTGFNIMGGLDLHFNKIVSLNFEFEFSSRSYLKEDILFNNEDPQNLREVRTNFHGSIPISLKFTYPGLIYYPYIYAGYSPSYTITSDANVIRNPDLSPEVSEPSLNLRAMVPDFTQSIILGIGLKRRFGYKYVLIDLRYRLGLTNMLKASAQYDFTNKAIRDYTFKYGMVSDDYRWNGFELTVGYVIPNYKPRAKNAVTIQTFLKGLFSKKSEKDDK